MRIERLDESHRRSSFHCGSLPLDTWFHDHALVAQRQDTARTFVLIDDQARRFYQRFGFRPVEGDPSGRLFLRTRDALASFPPDYGGT